MGTNSSTLDSTQQWDSESQRRFWNEWDTQHLQDGTIGHEALRRGQVVLSLLQTLRLKRPRIFEIGCGNGWLSEQLQDIGSVTGIDLADVAIQAARHRVPNAEFLVGDVLKMDLPKSYFDVVVTLETLSHVVDQSRLMEVAANALKESGYLIIATQNRFVYLRNSHVKPPLKGQIRHWVTRKGLRGLLISRFKCLRLFTIEPSGDTGILRVVNSTKLNGALTLGCSQECIQKIKEYLGFGQTIVALARKRR